MGDTLNGLRESGMVEEFVGEGGRLQFVTTESFEVWDLLGH